MPRRKTLPVVPDYTDAGESPDIHIVQKSNPLLTLSETGLPLSALKILDAYLARINSHDPEKRYVRFEKGALEKYLGVERIHQKDLEARLDCLFRSVTIRDAQKPHGFTKIALFEKAECYQDEDGLWQVDLAASYPAMEYIFNIDNLGYLRYRLKNVINLTSRYSYFLYLYLEDNRHMHLEWTVDLDTLKARLQSTDSYYDQYYRFNEKVLRRCHKEICEKTECQYTYAPAKRGRKVVGVTFTLQSLSVLKPSEVPIDPNQLSFDDVSSGASEIDSSFDGPFDGEPFTIFTPEQLSALAEMARSIVRTPALRDASVEWTLNTLPPADAIEYAAADHLKQIIFNAQARGAKNIYPYVSKTLENELKGT